MAEHGSHHDPHTGFLRPAQGSPHDYEGMVPLKQIDLSEIDGKGTSQKLRIYEEQTFAKGEWGRATRTLERMVTDKDSFNVLTLSGAMTPAQLGLVIDDMLRDGWFQAVVSTGALMAHGFIQSAGMQHYRAIKPISDPEANKNRMNRVLDTYEPEDNFDALENIFDKVLASLDPSRTYSSHDLTYKLGEYLHNNAEGRGILKTAFENDIPVFVPAIVDSELGLDFNLHNHKQFKEGKPILRYNDYIALDVYANLIQANVNADRRLGVFTIGGGVPRNYAQQVGPYLDLMEKRGFSAPGDKIAAFFRGVRICPDDVRWGGLSGCTYSEGMSWGKFWPDGEFGEIIQDPTIVMPDTVSAIQYRTGNRRIEKDVVTGRQALIDATRPVDLMYNPGLQTTIYEAA